MRLALSQNDSNVLCLNSSTSHGSRSAVTVAEEARDSARDLK